LLKRVVKTSGRPSSARSDLGEGKKGKKEETRHLAWPEKREETEEKVRQPKVQTPSHARAAKN